MFQIKLFIHWNLKGTTTALPEDENTFLDQNFFFDLFDLI
jgi:hypothetical protein